MRRAIAFLLCAVMLPGAGHGFYGADAVQAIRWILDYLEAHRQYRQ